MFTHIVNELHLVNIYDSRRVYVQHLEGFCDEGQAARGEFVTDSANEFLEVDAAVSVSVYQRVGRER
jgi:hypothetical protein